MNKAEYLAQSDVKSFIGWFARHISENSTLKHHYLQPGGNVVSFSNLADALHKYDWKFNFSMADGEKSSGRTFQQNRDALAYLKTWLSKAVRDGDDEQACAAAIAVMEWGGVSAGNAKWLRRNKTGLVALLSDVVKTLELDEESCSGFNADLRFNAGMTKVYSLLLKNFMIYDSRVAAALAWHVVMWRKSEKKTAGAIPESLNFPCMPAKEGVNSTIRKLRNPSAGQAQFQKMYSKARLHAQWNLRASWIVEAIASSSDTPFHRTGDPVRAIEAALFIWGYDLSKNSPWIGEQNLPESDCEEEEEDLEPEAQAVSPCWAGFPLVTHGGKAKRFNWKFDENEDAIMIRRENGHSDKFPIVQTFYALHGLFDQFGEDMIPLGNDVERLRDKTARDGLGKAIMNMRDANVALGQAASQLGPILEELGVFRWNGRRRNIEFHFLTSPPATIQALRELLMEYAR